MAGDTAGTGGPGEDVVELAHARSEEGRLQDETSWLSTDIADWLGR